MPAALRVGRCSGTTAAVRAISRTDLLDCYATNYLPGNAALMGNLIEGFPQRLETVGDVAVQLAEIVRYGLPEDEWTRRLASIRDVTAEVATRAASDRIDPDDLLIVVVGDRERIEPDLRELGLGEGEILDMSELQ